MSTKLKVQAERFLVLAIEAQHDGRLDDAHVLTLKAAEFLEDAVSMEELQRRLPLRE
jgi:hypothetical protein